MRFMVRETGQPETHPAARRAVISRPPGPVILDENEILQRAASHFRLRTRGDLEKLGTVTGFSDRAPGPDLVPEGKTGDCP
jgi:hypothetical protein